jgi:hypothetical protein
MANIVSADFYAVEYVDRIHKKKKALDNNPRAFQMAGVEGFEPPTQWLTATCSAD